MKKRKGIKTRWKILLGLLLALSCIQFIRPSLHNQPGPITSFAPPEIENQLKRSCYDCHSDNTKLKWFDNIVPAYWLVADDVKKGRRALNFSGWDSLPPGAQKAGLFHCLNQMEFSEMPLPQYSLLHPEAKINDSIIKAFKRVLLGLTAVKPSDSAQVNSGDRQYKAWSEEPTALPSPAPAPNGIEYIPGYKDWKMISSSDRFDNGTMRVIFGNEVAVRAIQAGNINPWPDGTIFAKLAWDKLVDSSGKAHAGAFKQVEFMIQDQKKYAASKGWGWARWLGMQLKPYGKNEAFTLECQGCHQPMKNNDYVFTMPIPLNPNKK
jgi:Cytochrome P460/Haem-binding domain